MPIGDPRDRFFYPVLTLMIDSYNIIVKWHHCNVKATPSSNAVSQRIQELLGVSKKKEVITMYLFEFGIEKYVPRDPVC